MVHVWQVLMCLHVSLSEKYDYIGRLLKPGEQPRDYTDTEDEQSEEQKDKTEEEKKSD